MNRLTIGFSPCPNDTFIFSHLVHGEIGKSAKTGIADPHLEDVETLNLWAMQARLDITKLSFHALGYVLDEYCVLQAGSALGRGCGPLLITKGPRSRQELESGTIAIPGKYTTAAMLFKMFMPECENTVEMRFEQIIESVKSGRVDGGVIIHESRFTYQESGLSCFQDLGQWWEDISGLPIPLGCIAARRSLGRERIETVDSLIKKSLERAFNNPESCWSYIKKHAQETDDRVIQSHIGLYVNDFSLDLGEEGREAIVSFINKGREVGILPEAGKDIFCLG